MLVNKLPERLKMAAQKYCTFYLMKEFFGIEVEYVQEVIRKQNETKIYLAPSEISGLINLRGHVVPVVNMRVRLEFGDSDDIPEKQMNVILKNGNGFIGFLVDKIGEVILLDTDDIKAVPETLSGTAKELITGTYNLENEVLLVLDSEKTKNIKVVL